MGGSGHFFLGKEGVTQGEPLAMIPYFIGTFPLICELCNTHFQVTQTWYADGVGVDSNFSKLRVHLEDLMVISPAGILY